MTDWQPGDVALCVDDSGWPAYGIECELRAGHRYTVTRVYMERGESPYGSGEILALELLELKNRETPLFGFDARRFIKQPSLVIESEEKQEEPVE